MKFIATFFVALATLVFPAAHASIVYDKAALVDYIVTSKHSKADAKTATLIVDAAFKAGDKYKVDPFYILSVIRAESNFNPKAKNRSGASGLMQVIPRWHPEKIKGRSLFNINVAVDVGTQVINEYLNASNDNLRKAMRKYSGGASDKYYKRIRAMHKELRDAVVAKRFERELPVLAPTYGDARSWHAEIDLSKQPSLPPPTRAVAGVMSAPTPNSILLPAQPLPQALPKGTSIEALLAMRDTTYALR